MTTHKIDLICFMVYSEDAGPGDVDFFVMDEGMTEGQAVDEFLHEYFADDYDDVFEGDQVQPVTIDGLISYMEAQHMTTVEHQSRTIQVRG